MRWFPDFFQRLDRSALRAVLVTCALFLTVIVILVLGKTGLLGSFEEVQAWAKSASEGPWGLAVLILLFCVAAFLGIPQFALISVAVVAFGPVLGFVNAWLATLVSGTLTFWLGRLAGEETFRRYAGPSANRFSAFIGRNSFAASLIVRNVPTGPFLIVNMAFGVSQARFSHYLAGMAIGVLPKLALVAFAGQSVMAALRGSPLLAVGAGGLAFGVWVVLMLYARKRVRQARQRLSREPAAEVDIPEGAGN